ncbi:MAG: phosphoribosyltransferase [Acidobacteria bacterium]|nr:phosphoribosyltransferase [Acidobacteriota bacterium]
MLPIAISMHGKGLHRRLRGYKDAVAKAERSECSLDLAVLLSLFLERHSDCLGGMPDVVVTVPSTDRDALRAVINRLPSLRDRHIRVLRAVGSKTERRYEVDERTSERVAGRRVLLLDDTFTSGRSITAAYGALANVGAKIVRPLVMGRHFYPDYDTSVDLWDCLRKHTWSLKRCGICGPISCPT